MSLDWQAVGAGAAAVASIVAVAGIVLAYRGVRISRDASLLDRRNYLDGLFVRWLDSVDALDRAALPFISHIPTQQELDAGSANLPQAYSEFHLAFQRCRSATTLLGTTGLFDNEIKIDQREDIATEDLTGVFDGVLWAHYFSVIQYSPAEATSLREGRGAAQPWSGAVDEVEVQLSEHDVPNKYFPLFRASIKRLYPETANLSVWQAADQVLSFSKAQIANRYSGLVSSRFPWDRKRGR